MDEPNLNTGLPNLPWQCPTNQDFHHTDDLLLGLQVMDGWETEAANFEFDYFLQVKVTLAH